MESNTPLLIYYSRAGIVFQNKPPQKIGNTKIIINYIKELINVDEFELIPKNKYPEDYIEISNIAKKEFEERELVPLANKEFPDISKYNTIIIGFPIWMDTFPMVINTFLQNYPTSVWKQKHIFVVTTHEGSIYGKSINDVKDICKDAIIQPGISFNGYKVSSGKEKTKKWLEKIGLLVTQNAF